MCDINLQLFAVTYDKDTDYQKLINQAVKEGNYSAAAQYEQQRNAKIADLNASGANQYNAQQSTNYAQYLDPGYQGTGTYHDMGLSASQQDAIDGYKNQYYTAKSLNDQAGMDAAHQAAELIRQQAGYSGGGDGSEYIKLNTVVPTFDYDLNSQPTYTSQYGTKIDQMLNELLNRDSFSYNVAAPTYTDNYTGKINDLMGQIENREAFSYDAASDPLYQQYQKQYQREGDRSMRNTMAEAASYAGGMNSYAMTAAQQASDYYASQLNDKIPELAQLAYQMYMQDFDQDVAELNLLRGLGETEYNRYRDSYSDYLNERNTAYQMYLDEIEKQINDLGILQSMDATQYDRYRDTMSDWRNDRDFAYGMYRDDMGDYQWRSEFDYSKEQDKIGNDFTYGQITGTMPSYGDNGPTNTLSKEEFEHGKKQDDISNSQWDKNFNAEQSDTAYARALDLLSSGVGTDSVVSLLVDAGFTQAQAKGIVSDVQKSMSEPVVGDDLVNDIESIPITDRVKEATSLLETKPEEEEVELNMASVNNLGLGPVTATFLAEIQQYGGIVEDNKGNVFWAPGWNADNYKEKMELAKNGVTDWLGKTGF